ncbi:hypothetical protein SPSIL_052400 [Sporomusa silvacetica DSM 10669]|uniref:Uncharacterized protein n=1 Tax=Sporomusa silvacetica DSM 10669 TaxID=1123289 RepID=A0ABZ3IUB0_9FIRM|nr:hypothetical protein [Sporomusa silvacetica]OZC19669.1 hypothetical protein SPSIL_20990 [Sporomusa silvacetica DSM 10669]
MPLPFILGAVALAAAGFGAKKAMDAQSDNNEAEQLRERAEDIYDEAKSKLEDAKESTAETLDNLGWLKLDVWNRQMGRFVDLAEKVRNVELTGQASNDEFKLATFTRQELGEIKSMSLKASEVVSGGSAALGAGALAGVASYGGVMMLGTASTGTAIASLTGVAATNATLAWLGGGSLAAGGLGIAGGMAVLGGIVAGPVLAIGGMFFASKAKENLSNARNDWSKAKRAAEEMNNASAKLQAIESIAELFHGVINMMDSRMGDILSELQHAVISAEQRERSKFINKIKSFFGISIRANYANMTLEEQQILHLSYQAAQVTKILLETPLLTSNGDLRSEDEINQAFVKIVSIDSDKKLLPEISSMLNGDDDFDPMLLAAATRS